MNKREDVTLLIFGIVLTLAALLVIFLEPRFSPRAPMELPMPSGLLSDPFLQSPTSNSVRVVWFTEFPGLDHRVIYGTRPDQTLGQGEMGQVAATTRQLTRLREDQASHLSGDRVYKEPTFRPVWRHEAEVTGLIPGQRVPYQVISRREDGSAIASDLFTLAANPPPDQPLKILLTSDHQLMPMTAANLQKVGETIGLVDGIFLAGDLVNIPDRASEWFDDSRGGAFFPALQGRADYALDRGGTTRYQGAALIQHAPLFAAIGNHEVMGRRSPTAALNDQFNDPIPRTAALNLYNTYADVFNPTGDPALRRKWIIDQSYNTDTYEQIFSLPQSQVPNPDGPEQTSRYYATTFGDVRLISLFVTNIWRSPGVEPSVRGRYRERQQDLAHPGAWGHGQHIFEPIQPGSLQYQWLEQELASPEFRQAKYKVVMFHHPPHSLGDNVVPAFTDPVPIYDRAEDGALQAIRYEYPIQNDYLIRDLIPLLEQAGVDLVLYGHSHIWNRFVSPSGLNFLETSNVGNTYGAFLHQSRPIPPAAPTEELDKFQADYYAAQGDPNGLSPILPTLAPLTDEADNPLPYLASNDITAFSIFDTGAGTISSYYFDTRDPDSTVVKFDEFALN
ncbi:purple acid phosphatase family protein [Leptolyngbya sp. PCC 6406]|uniref:purple acid phosphatase family protein n=1 Tax=Leptolyngbya sp. PCC 6406 TaxID=1173264 RepID=UPI0002AC27EA|nr:metallophosphoesterase family protein [Leptolyngbya sp. PCC 6406]